MKWKTEKLNKIADIFGGYAFKSQYFCDDGNYKVIRIGDIFNGGINIDSCKKIDNISFKISPTFTARKGDVLMALSGATTGKTGIITKNEEGCLVNQRIAIIRGKSDENKKYIKYIFTNATIRELLKSAGGVAQPNLSPKMLNSLDIPVPPLPEQKRIADILDKADSLRKKRQQTIEQCDEFLKSTFLDMFGDPVKENKKWKVKQLKDISIKILSGNTPKGGKKVYVKDGVTFFRSQNVWKNRLVLDDIAYIDKATHDKMKTSSLMNKDILMTKTGRINTENSSLGRAALFMGEDDSANINGHVYLIRLQKDMIHEFIVFILTTDEYREHIRSVCVGGIDKRQLNKQHLEEFPIIFPPIGLQKKFASIIKKTETIKQIMQQQLKELNDNFNSLTQRAFKGEL